MLELKVEKVLELVFSGEDEFSRQILNLLPNAQCLEIENTGVGYYATVKFDRNIYGIKIPSMRDINFSHPQLLYGGTFICSLISSNLLELEAVTFGHQLWPGDLDVKKCTKTAESKG